jgi:hypothetical protein
MYLSMSRTSGDRASLSPTLSPLMALGRWHASLALDVYSEPDKRGMLITHGFKDIDLTTQWFASLVEVSMMGQTVSVLTTNASGFSVTAGTATNTPQISFGVGTTSALYSDHAIGTATTGTNPVTATVSAVSVNNSVSGSWNLTATWNNTTGNTVNISELATYLVNALSSGMIYCVTHDVFAAQAVSNGGSAAATITITNS